MYNIVFDEHLEHHGILGMHWGIRRYQNPDGSLTAEGRARYKVGGRDRKKIQNVVRESEYNEDVADEVFKIAKADKGQLSKARESVASGVEELKSITKESEKIFSGLNPSNKHVYEAVSEITDYADFWGNGDVDNLTISTIASAGFMGVCEDGQQQKINAFSLYANKENKLNDIHSLVLKSSDIEGKMRTDCKTILNNALEEVGADDINVGYKGNYKVGEALTNQIVNNATGDWENVSSGPWYLRDADYKFTEKDKSNAKKAEKIVSNVKSSNKFSTWLYLDLAVDDCGLSEKKASELTKADWDKINARVDELRPQSKVGQLGH